jgi:hypothetical protein
MAEFSRDELRELLSQQTGPFVTLTMPTLRTRTHDHENTVRLKNLLREANQMLTQLHYDDPQALLAPARTIQDNAAVFVRAGVAMFFSGEPNQFRYYMVDAPLEEKVVVADRYAVKPLLPLLTHINSFYVLALSQNEVYLLKGAENTIRRVDVPKMPKNMDDALQLQGNERAVFERSTRPPSRIEHPDASGGIRGEGVSPTVRGAGERDYKQYIEQYCLRVNEALHPYLKEKTAPLILMAVDFLHPLYKATNTYPHLLEDGIIGNPASFDAQAIVERARTILAPLVKRKQRDAVARYAELITKNQASNKPLDILRAAYAGQVDTLFVQKDASLWGVFKFETEHLEVHTEQHAGDVDLFDLAATQTILNAGTVYAVAADEMPDNSPIAAVYRFAL